MPDKRLSNNCLSIYLIMAYRCIYITSFIAYFDIVPLKVLEISDHDSTLLTVIMTVDKHELLFRMINRGLFSLWSNCVTT